MIPLNAFDSFLFDLDGTLVDSIPAMMDSYEDFAARYGFTPTVEEFRSLNGPSLPEIVRILMDRYAIAEDFETTYTAYIRIIQHRTERIAAFPEAAGLLRMIRQMGKSVILVTSSPRRSALPILENNRLLDLLDGAVFGDDAEKSKPDPEPYRIALERFGLSCHSTCAFEDSPNGIISATRAGLTAFAVNTSPTPMLVRCGAVRFYESLSHVTRHLNGPDAVFSVLYEGPFSVRVTQAPPPSSEALVDVCDAIWQKTILKYPHMYNGSVAYVDTASIAQDSAFLLRYGEFMVSLAKQYGLFDSLCPAGTSGIILNVCNGSMHSVVGRRNTPSGQYHGYYELIPSGHIETRSGNADADILASLMGELEEEAGIAASLTHRVEKLGVIRDNMTDTVDFCYAIHTALNPDDILREASQRGEYTDIRIIPIPMAVSAAELLGMVPTSLGIIHCVNNAIQHLTEWTANEM